MGNPYDFLKVTVRFRDTQLLSISHRVVEMYYMCEFAILDKMSYFVFIEFIITVFPSSFSNAVKTQSLDDF